VCGGIELHGLLSFDTRSFTSADEVNLFLGNLIRQLARKRIARRDAIALAYISQLLLTSQTAMAKEEAAELETADLRRYLLKGLGHPRSTPQDGQSPTESAEVACPEVGRAAGPGADHERRLS